MLTIKIERDGNEYIFEQNQVIIFHKGSNYYNDFVNKNQLKDELQPKFIIEADGQLVGARFDLKLTIYNSAGAIIKEIDTREINKE